MKKTLLTLLLTILTTSGIFSQYWTLTNNQYSSSKFGMMPDGSVFALTNQTFLYKSTSDGVAGSWNGITGFPTENSYNIHVYANTVFLMNGDGIEYDGRGIFASSDGGVTWESRNNGLGADTNMVQMYTLANGILLVGTTNGLGQFNLYRSEDGGNSWNLAQTFAEIPSSITYVSNTEAYMAIGGGVFKSVDNGESWFDLNAVSSSRIVTILPKSDGNLIAYANNNYDIMESTDGGSFWTTLTTVGLPSLAGNAITSFRKLHGDRIYLAMDNNQGVFYSDDDGENWADITFNITSSQIFGRSLAVNANGYLFASPSTVGIFRSDDPVTPSTVSTAKIDELNNAYKVYPNPAKDHIYVEIPNDNSGEIEIFNQFGQVLYSREYASPKEISEGINISDLSRGVYFVRYNTPGKSETLKFIVK